MTRPMTLMTNNHTSIKLWIDKNFKGDPIIWCIAFLLSAISILVIYSAAAPLAYRYMQGDTGYYLFKHSLLIVLSLFFMWVAHKIDYRFYSKISKFALWISVPLLLFMLFLGETIHGATRWITIPVINQSFQPSDFAKLALIANVASILSKKQQNIADIKDSITPVLLWCGIICTLIGLTDISSAILLFATCMLLMFIGRVPVKYLLMLCLIGVIVGGIVLGAGQRKETAINRIRHFINSKEIPFQAQQSYIAIARGRNPAGPGNSTQRNFLPQPYSDFVYAIIIEEYGLIGGALVIFLYLALLYRGMVAVAKSGRAFGGLLSAGLSFSIVVQAMINMGVVVGLGPISGITLPMLSMGGNSLIFTGITLGIILSVSRGEIEEIGS